MKYFLELIEVARTGGVCNGEATQLSPEAMELFWRAVENCQPFVFTPKNETPEEVETQPDSDQEYSLKEGAPFTSFSIEVLGKPVCSPRMGDHPVSLYCLLTFEAKDGVFVFVGLAKIGSITRVIALNNLGNIVDEFLKRLNQESVGREAGRTRVKIGTGSGKRTATYHGVIHVVPRKLRATYSGSRPVDWSYRFPVRGHWRVIEGLGKDRNGVYREHNRTWVSDHVRGDEKLPLVDRKTRVV